MRRFFLPLVLVLGWVVASAQTSAPPATLAELQQRLTEHITNPRFAAAMWGVKIVSLDSGKTLFEQNAEKLFSPASNCKLYPTALALDQLGGDYRIRTSLLASDRPDRRGTLKGDLIVYGRGDPTFNARRNSNDVFRALQPLVAALTNAGVRRIAGDLVGDESFLQGPPFGSSWAWDDLDSYYGAELSALTIDDNTVQIAVTPGTVIGAKCQLAGNLAVNFVTLSNRTQTGPADSKRSLTCYRPLGENVVYVSGSVPLGSPSFSEDVSVHHPGKLFVALFQEALRRNGIKVSGKVRTLSWLDRQVQPFDPAKFVELGAVESVPLRDIVREIQKPSQNLYTDLLLAHLGAAAATNVVLPLDPGEPALTSEERGIGELEKFLTKAGIAPGEVRFNEGSGLSRNNLATPNATARLLQFMSQHREADAYLNALPIAGVDGTLRNRMKNPPAVGNVRAKTGTLKWANSLSGQVTTAAGEHLIFCLMLNRYAPSDRAHSGPAELDHIATLLAEFTGRSDGK